MSNNIDDLFRKALLNQESQPPAHVWKNIEKQLDKRRRIVAGWWLRGVSAAAVIAIVFSVWQLSHQDTANQLATYSPMNIPTYLPVDTAIVPQNSLETTADDAIVLACAQASQVTNVAEKVAVPYKDSDLARIREMAISGISTPASQKSLKIKTAHQNIIPLTSKEAFKNNQEYQVLLKNEAPIKSNGEGIKIALSGHFAPTYSGGNYSSSVKNPRGYSYSGDQMDGILNAGGGLKLSINTSKRLSFQTGVLYSRMGQKTKEDNSGPRTAAFSTDHRLPRVATPLGNVKTQRKSVAYRSSEATILNSIASNDETLEQTFGTVEIPLYVRYKLNDNKIQFSVVGGFSGNIIVNNKVYLKSGSEKELLGSTEDIRNFNMSTDWGLGVEYPVSPKIKVMIEPGFKYYLQSLSRNEYIDFKPYMFTFSTGIGIEF